MDFEYTLDYYIEIGAIEIAGIEEDGEFIFKVTPLAKEIAPELWEIHQEHIDGVLLDLFEKELLTVIYDEELNATIELTEEGRIIAETYGLVELDDED